MPRFEGKFLSVVLVGHQNPQILNHDFLVKNNILPVDKDPFKTLIDKDAGRPFDEFVSVPILATIRYGHVSITVQEDRYQILDNRFGSPADSPIFDITRNYFQKHLKYTPFTVGGMNLNGIIYFSDLSDELKFDERLGINRPKFAELLRADGIRTGATVAAAHRNGLIEVQIAKPKDGSPVALFNLNYEFKYEEIGTFMANLDDAEALYHESQRILLALGVEQ